MADGCINDSQLIVSVDESDVDHLDKLSCKLRADLKWVHRTNDFNPEGNYMVRMTANNVYLIREWRELFKLTGPKTYYPPNLSAFENERLLLPFVVGLIDGDGNIQYGRQSEIRIKTHRSWEAVYGRLSELLSSLYPINSRVKVNRLGFVTLIISGKPSLHFIRNNIHNLPFMQRKWDKINTTK